jgi:hypothetical protein
MVILGLLFMLVGALAIVAAVFVSDGTGTLLGIDMSALAIFLVGVGAGAAVIWGYTILKYGTKRGLQQRKERKRLTELSHKLEQVEAERRTDSQPDETS